MVPVCTRTVMLIHIGLSILMCIALMRVYSEDVLLASRSFATKMTKVPSSEQEQARTDPPMPMPMLMLKERHPHCFSNHLFVDSNNKKHLKANNKRRLRPIEEIGKYKLIGRNVKTNEIYDHQCPYFLKDRYNCARNNTDILEYGDNPTDWKLTLIPPHVNAGECNLWDFVHELGGPVGVANAQEIDGDDDGDGANKTKLISIPKNQRKKKPFVVLMMGNSYLRQAFEALSCGWSPDITDYRATINATACWSMACMKEMEKQGKLTFDMDEVGNVTSLLTEAKKSCVADESSSCKPKNSKIEAFYRKGVRLPNNFFSSKTNDNLAMVEFGNSIQFYYMFRPYLHSNLTAVLEKGFGLDPADVNTILFNDGQDEEIARHTDLIRIFKSTGVWQRRSIWPYSSFQNIQTRDIGRWFGADNPWITHVPDGHACMPGPPDDEVNLLLFLIFSKAQIR